MGSVATVMDEVITGAVDPLEPAGFAFHSAAQAGDSAWAGHGEGGEATALTGELRLSAPAAIRSRAGLGRDASPRRKGSWKMRPPWRPAWGRRLVRSGGLRADPAYGPAGRLRSAGTIDWRGFLPSERLQGGTGGLRVVLLKTRQVERGLRNVVGRAMALRGMRWWPTAGRPGRAGAVGATGMA